LTGNFSDVDIERLFGERLFCFTLSAFRAWVLVLMTGENTRRRLLVVSAPVGCAGGVLSSCRG